LVTLEKNNKNELTIVVIPPSVSPTVIFIITSDDALIAVNIFSLFLLCVCVIFLLMRNQVFPVIVLIDP
jgi:hypothetical protein